MRAFKNVDPASVTPEHLQLLSDARLRAIAERGTPDDPSVVGTDQAWKRLARYELKRRHEPHLRRRPDAAVEAR